MKENKNPLLLLAALLGGFCFVGVVVTVLTLGLVVTGNTEPVWVPLMIMSVFIIGNIVTWLIANSKIKEFEEETAKSFMDLIENNDDD